MRIAVFCSASTKIDNKYVDFAFEVGKAIAEQGWDVAWGGGTLSMMGSVSRGARSAGGKTFGVIPQKLIGKEFADEEATELFVTESMRSRKAMLERNHGRVHGDLGGSPPWLSPKTNCGMRPLRLL